MGLLERRRLLFQNAVENALDGKYVAFIQLNTSSNARGNICLSSDYGHTFEVIYTGNFGAGAYQHPDVAIDVVEGKPIVYFTSGSNSKSAIYRWKDGTVTLYLTCPGNYFITQYLACLDHDVLLNLDGGYSKIHLLYSGSAHTYPDVVSGGNYIKGTIKVRRKEGAVLFGTYLSTSTNSDIWWGKYTTPETFKLSSGSAYHMVPSGTKPSAGYIEDFDISPDGKDAVITTLQGGAIIGNNLTSNPSWYHIPYNELGPSYTGFMGVTYSDNKSFLGYRTGSNTARVSQVNRYSNHVIRPANLEITEDLPAPQGTYQNSGIFTMSLWSDTSGKNLVSLNKGYSNQDTYMAYSNDAGLTWTRSSHISGSGLVIASADVYRL